MKYFFFIILICFAACTKHAGDLPEHIPSAIVEISKPTEGQMFNAGDSIQIKATAISTETIHGYDVYLTKQNDTARLYTNHVHDHNDTLFIDQKWKFDNAFRGNLEAHILLALDHDGHTLHKKVNVTVK